MSRPLKPLSEIGQEIKQKREALEWSQSDLARQSGVSRQTISGLETGVATDVKWSVLEKLAQPLGGLDVLAIPQGYKEKATAQQG